MTWLVSWKPPSTCLQCLLREHGQSVSAGSGTVSKISRVRSTTKSNWSSHRGAPCRALGPQHHACLRSTCDFFGLLSLQVLAGHALLNEFSLAALSKVQQNLDRLRIWGRRRFGDQQDVVEHRSAKAQNIASGDLAKNADPCTQHDSVEPSLSFPPAAAVLGLDPALTKLPKHLVRGITTTV